jgi:NAD(P)-dependent dehydrogenase (short-subunit alcohol dehydrogenase family)
LNQQVLITGVSGGIGSATAALLKADGWSVVGLDKVKPDSDLELDHFIEADLSSAEETANAFAAAYELGPFQALVNNAAMQAAGPLVEMDAGTWDALMAVNLRAAFLGIKGLFPRLREGKGCVVNVASVHAVATSRGAAAYAASKGGLVALTRAAALELAPDGIRVNAVLPGAVATPMLREGMLRLAVTDADSPLKKLFWRTPMARVGRPDEIAEAIMFLSDTKRSSFITGQALIVDGGATVRLSTE